MIDAQLPNIRLKLAGGDRSKGSGVLCAGTHELSFNDTRASRPQLKRDPLGRTRLWSPHYFPLRNSPG